MRDSFLFAIDDDNAYCGVATRNGVAIKAIKSLRSLVTERARDRPLCSESMNCAIEDLVTRSQHVDPCANLRGDGIATSGDCRTRMVGVQRSIRADDGCGGGGTAFAAEW